jgi:hypothetical protein
MARGDGLPQGRHPCVWPVAGSRALAVGESLLVHPSRQGLGREQEA